MPVEVPGVTGLGMDQDCPAVDVLGEGGESQEYVLEQACAESSALMPDVHAEACEEGDGPSRGPHVVPARLVRAISPVQRQFLSLSEQYPDHFEIRVFPQVTGVVVSRPVRRKVALPRLDHCS
jgi:hypothetical protein